MATWSTRSAASAASEFFANFMNHSIALMTPCVCLSRMGSHWLMMKFLSPTNRRRRCSSVIVYFAACSIVSFS